MQFGVDLDDKTIGDAVDLKDCELHGVLAASLPGSGPGELGLRWWCDRCLAAFYRTAGRGEREGT